MKKNLFVLLGVALLAQAYAVGNNDDDDEDMKVYSDTQKNKQTTCTRSVDVTEMNPKSGSWNASAWAGFTYWNGNFDGLSISTIETSTTSQKTLFPNVTTRPGFIVGLGYMCPESAVSYNAQYTWFYNKQKQGVYTSVTLPGAADEYSDSFQKAGGSVANTFNRVDFVMDKEFMLGKYFNLVPGGGFVGNWGKVYLDEKFENPLGNTGLAIVTNTDSKWGVGPYFHLSSKFIVPTSFMSEWSRFVFFMNGGLGFSWMESKLTYVTTSTFESVKPLQAYFTYNFLTTLLDGNIGLGWEMTGDDHPYGKFGFNVAWSMQQWLDYTQVEGQNGANTFSLQGLTAALGVSF